MRTPPRFLASLAAAITLASLPLQAPAATIALVIAIDTSGSIDATEFDLQRQAYVNFFDDNAAAFATADVAVTVMYWAGEGVQEQVVPWTELRSASDAEAFAAALLTTSRPDISGPNGAQTGVARALTAAQDLFALQSFEGASLVLDISGDGTENLDFGPISVLDTVVLDVPGVGSVSVDVRSPWAEVFAARAAVLDAGILINALPILPVPPVQDVEIQDSAPAIDFFPPPEFVVNGAAVDVSAEWAAALSGLGYDQTSLLELFYGRVIGSPDARIPLMIVANGFTAEELGQAISQKLALELGVPEPSATLLLAAFGVAALFVARRSRQHPR